MARDRLNQTTRAQLALIACQDSLRAAAEALAAMTIRADEAAAQRRQVQSALEELTRRQNELIKVVLHDQISALTAIKGWVQLLQRRVQRMSAMEAAAIMEGLAQIDRKVTATAATLRALEAELTEERSGWPGAGRR